MQRVAEHAAVASPDREPFARMLARDIILVLTITLAAWLFFEFVDYGVPDPRTPPDHLVLWGHEYTFEGGCCGDSSRTPETVLASAIEAGSGVRIVTPAFGTLGLIPFSFVFGRPADPVSTVYYRAGPDSYVRYRLHTCCEAAW